MRRVMLAVWLCASIFVPASAQAQVSGLTELEAKMFGEPCGHLGSLILLAAEEGKNADAVNLAVIDRVWNLWKQRVQPTLK